MDAVKSNAPDGLLTKDEIAILESLKVSLVILPDDSFDDPPPPVNPQCFLVIGKIAGVYFMMITENPKLLYVMHS